MQENQDHSGEPTVSQTGSVDKRPLEFDLYAGIALFLAAVHSVFIQLPGGGEFSTMANSVAYILLALISSVGVMKGSKLAFCAVVLLWVSSSSSTNSYESFQIIKGMTEAQRLIWYFSGLIQTCATIYCAGRLAGAFREQPKLEGS